MKTEVDIDLERDLTIFTAEGLITADEIISVITKYYIDTPTKLVLWDCSKGVTNNLSNEDIQKLAEAIKNNSSYRINGKTALVDPVDSHFGIMRMYETYQELRDSPIEYFVSRNVDDAMEWLLSDDVDTEAGEDFATRAR